MIRRRRHEPRPAEDPGAGEARQIGDEVHILCQSDGREQKDRAIREKHEQRLLAELRRCKRVATGKLKDATKVHQAIGRLKERYPRVARYYAISTTPTAR